jgi:hypothetical protein
MLNSLQISYHSGRAELSSSLQANQYLKSYSLIRNKYYEDRETSSILHWLYYGRTTGPPFASGIENAYCDQGFRPVSIFVISAYQ